MAHWNNLTIHLAIVARGKIGEMPAHYALVGGLKPPQNSKSNKKAWIMPFLRIFGVYFPFLLWALAHIPIIFLSYSFILYFLYSFCRFWDKFHAPRMALAYDKAGQKEFFITFILYISFKPCLGQMAFNVSAVTDGFLFAIRKLRSSFSQTKNCGGTKYTKGEARLYFCVARAAVRRRSSYRPVEIAEKLFSVKKHS